MLKEKNKRLQMKVDSMKILQKVYNNETYYYINKYEFSFGTIHKFANQEKVIFCKEENNEFIVIHNKRILKKIMKNFENIKIKDII